MSRFVRAGSFHALGHAFLSSPTLRATLERAARFSRVTSDIAVGVTDLDGPEIVLSVGWRDERERPAWESVDAAFASIVRTCRHLLGRNVSPTRVAFERLPPINVARFDQFFGCTVRFDAPTSLLAFDRVVAEPPVPGSNDRLAAASDQAVAAYLASLNPATVVDQVRHVLVDVIAAGEPDIRAVARELAISPRSLQRQSLNTAPRTATCSPTHDRISPTPPGRWQHRDRHRLRLGFSETAAFSRAYRRWTGTTPSSIRARPPDSPPTRQSRAPRT